jgi:hypothetical protein
MLVLRGVECCLGVMALSKRLLPNRMRTDGHAVLCPILHGLFSNVVEVRPQQLRTLDVVPLVQFLIDRMRCIC